MIGLKEKLKNWLQDTLEIRTPEEAELAKMRQYVANLNNAASALDHEISMKKDELVELDEALLLQSFSLYKPQYEFTNSEQYRQKLDSIREQQKYMLKNNIAAYGATDWTVNGSKREGNKMVRDTQKLLLRAFNSECEFVTSKVKYNNYDSCRKRIETAYNTIQKLGVTMQISINPQYYSLKIQEMYLALEYQQAKQREKEHEREMRAQMREEAKLQQEIEEEREKIKKEQAHYKNALKDTEAQLATASDTEKELLLEKKRSLEEQLSEIDKNLKDVDYREANQKAGYVYVISNIGSFGENVYKIGMTRRLDPMDRVSELGDASVPFNFDVHAMIFSDNAPKLEAALHRAFENKKLNMINTRREFFNVTLDEIEQVVKSNFDRTVEFIRTADAEQYRESLKIREQINS
ncbi:DUF4041 domain-containing protein [Anaerovibrio sp. RM50]|uniref:DUF4041 domain-containing protein n=1 Tax=Anaerovibrio sp. RM50 TaxID=1200557 RepID=UPI00056A39C0|nr:DUF4041 domain-containing protein [Anaerovibrio sp. RM50]